MLKDNWSMVLFKDKKVLSAVAMIVVLLMACSDSLWDDLPSPISKFITTYYPNTAISQYSDENNQYRVVVKNGPTMTFDSQFHWTMVDGNGVALPSIFAYNEMPGVYEFLQARDETNNVFKAVNNARTYVVTLSDRIIEYIKESGEIRPYIPDEGK
ncbi:MAG: hypothetical protein NC343_07980 [Muribaculum sp.]|nr:hypothetical protein [Muribaculaceae bacterium]MCM1081674.1 hypothetical protein [Muribaculum sp.]